MFDLGIAKLGKKIILEEEWLAKIFGADTKYHDIVTVLLFFALSIKMYIQGEIPKILKIIKQQKTNLGRTAVFVAILIVIFKKNEIMTLSFQHAFFAIFFHVMSHTDNLENIFWFSLIAMYNFNSSAVGE